MAWSTWIQLCGRLAVQRDELRVEHQLPGRQGVCLLGFLAANQDRWVTRDELVFAVWADAAPPDPDAALSSLLSKLRRAVGPDRIAGRSLLRFVSDDTCFVDVHYALESLHRGQAYLGSGRPKLGWQPAHTAFAITRRSFLLGLEAPWIDEWRRRLGEVELAALECWSRCALEVDEPATAEKVARFLVDRAPFRESGYSLLMSVLERNGNRAEALLVYDRLRCLLADELGATPGPEVATLHQRLLRAGG